MCKELRKIVCREIFIGVMSLWWVLEWLVECWYVCLFLSIMLKIKLRVRVLVVGCYFVMVE